MLNWLGISAVNPLLLWGALAVGVPILIHLLTKRRFKILDWAAMEFLLEADRRNRRRVRFENLLLLLLRCLAVLLLAFLVARLYLMPTGLAALAARSAGFERVVLLDDSPSMAARSPAGRSAFEQARIGLSQFVRAMSADRPADTFTLLLTSRPDRPLFHGQYLTPDSVETVVRTIDNLKTADLPARPASALRSVIDTLDLDQKRPNTLLYIVTDLRRHDWLPPALKPGTAGPDQPTPTTPTTPATPTAITDATDGPSDTPTTAAKPHGGESAVELLRRLTERVERLALVELGDPEPGNLGITAIQADEPALVAGVRTPLRVTLTNFGSEPARDVPVTLSLGGTASLRELLPVVEPGGSAAAVFHLTFPQVGSIPITAAIEAPDVLPQDNTRHHAGRVTDGLPVLVVDGDPSADPTLAESLYLATALAPGGDIPSTSKVSVVSDLQFEQTPLSRYRVVFLCNLFRLGEDSLAALRRWVRGGGGLVIFLGDQVDPIDYNARLAAGPEPLMPMLLDRIEGDIRRQKWSSINLDAAEHPIVSVFAGAQNPFLQSVKVFRWWRMILPEDSVDTVGPVAGTTDAAAADAAAATFGTLSTLLASLNDPDRSPLITEHVLGRGRVVVVATAADADWSNWPGDPSYVVAMQEIVRHVSGGSAVEAAGIGEPANVPVGAALRHTLDPARHRIDAVLTGPDGQSTQLQANIQAPTPAPGDDPTAEPAADPGDTPGDDPAAGATAAVASAPVFTVTDTARAGFYSLLRKTQDGGDDPLLYAANREPFEGRLERLTPDALRQELGDAPMDILRGPEALALGVSGGRVELWRTLAFTLLAVLMIEQFAAWWIGRHR